MDDKTKADYQLKFVNYLKNYRNKKNISQKQFAKEMNWAISLIGLFESSNTKNRFISCIEFLTEIAKIENMTIREFFNYLESGSVTRNFEEWQNNALQFISKLEIQTFYHLTELFEKSLSDDSSLRQTENIFKLVIQILELDDKKIEIIKNLVHEFNKEMKIDSINR